MIVFVSSLLCLVLRFGFYGVVLLICFGVWVDCEVSYVFAVIVVGEFRWFMCCLH